MATSWSCLPLYLTTWSAEKEMEIIPSSATIKTATVFDYETGSTLSIRVQAKDELNATVEGNFTVTLEDVFEDLDGDGLDTDGDGLTDNFESQRYVYQMVNGSFTWEQAKLDAESRGGHLAIV